MARRSEGFTIQFDPRNGNYVTQFRIAGRKFRRSTKSDDPAAAKVIAATLYRQALNESTRKASANPSLAVLFDEWLADIEHDGGYNDRYITTQARRAVKLAERFPTIADLTSHAQRSWHRERLEQVTATTLRRDLVPLRECLRWAFDEGKLEEPVQVVTPKKKRQAPGKRALNTERVDLTAEQVEALIAELPERTRKGHPIRALVTLAWETQLRHGGLFRLEAGRHFKRGQRVLFMLKDNDKNEYERPLPLTERGYRTLDEIAPEVGLIFPKFDYRKSLRSAAKRVGISGFEGLDLRDFRHASTTDALRASGNALGTSYMAGHVQQGTTSRYVHPAIEDGQKVLHARFGTLNEGAGRQANEADATARTDAENGRALAFGTPCAKTSANRAENADSEALKTGRIANI